RRALLPPRAAADASGTAAGVDHVCGAAGLRRAEPGGLLLLVPRAARAPGLARRRRRPPASRRDGPARRRGRPRLCPGARFRGYAAALLQRVDPAGPLLRRV